MAKRCSPKFKFHVVLQVLAANKTNAQVTKPYGVHPDSVSTRRQMPLESGPEIIVQDRTVAQYERRMAELERMAMPP